MRLISFCAATAAATLVFSGVTAANADTGASDTITTEVSYSQDCLNQLQSIETSTGETVDESICTLTTTLTESPEVVVSPGQISADSSLSASQKDSLMAAAAAGTVKSKHYTKATTGGVYTATQDGTFYYDGSRAWVGTTYRGKKGTHVCRANYAVGVSISTNSCSESGSNSARAMYYGWTVSWLVKGSPVSYAVSNTVTVKNNGSTA